jgi:hypothetical protein
VEVQAARAGVLRRRLGRHPRRADDQAGGDDARLFPLFEAVSIPFVAEFVGEGGAIVPNEVMEKAAGAMLDELLRVSGAFAQLRAA